MKCLQLPFVNLKKETKEGSSGFSNETQICVGYVIDV